MSGIGGETKRTVTSEGGSGQLSSGYVLVVSMPSGVRRFVLPADPSAALMLGREAPADLVVADDSVSRRHAVIHGGSPPEIQDVGSMNGTKVTGRKLGANERAPLTFGSVVEIGSIVGFVQPNEGSSTEALIDALPVSQRPSERMTYAPPPAPHAPKGNEPRAIIRDATMRQLYELIDVIAPSKLSVLILGETGVGKDVYAETVHARSPRGMGPFVRLNCAALPENLLEAELFGYERGAFTGAVNAKPGLFESADTGTVFLDEIGEMPLATQAKLLRVLESGEVLRIGSLKPRRVDVRFVSATNRDLEALSAIEKFRSDLFFRLNGVGVTIPPLRKRIDDIVPLAESFLGKAGALTPAAVERLCAYRWPGNIRELKNVIERSQLLARGGPISVEHLSFTSQLGGAPPASANPLPPSAPQPAATTQPSTAAQGMPIRDAIADVERQSILDAMDRCGGNQSRAAKMLGISRTTLIKRLEQYGYTRPRKGQD